MMTTTAVGLIVIKTLDLVLGGLITFYAYRAYHRTNSSPLGLFTIGFGLLTIGAMSAGIVDLILPFSLELAVIIEGVLSLIGFVFILHSVRV